MNSIHDPQPPPVPAAFPESGSAKMKDQKLAKREILYDGHIHMPTHWPAMKDMDSPARFAAKAKRAGITGGMIISTPPRERDLEAPFSNAQRMDAVLDYCGKLKNYYP